MAGWSPAYSVLDLASQALAKRRLGILRDFLALADAARIEAAVSGHAPTRPSTPLIRLR